ncbi:hypothetical protein [Sorangium sp. So ce1182]|uniref:hypothetical protein n=1 Tax=Sorangium sp. So ce1182 TaxID=3133334 RepID=UPI003F6056BA
MLKGQLALGAVQIVNAGSDEVIGYAYTVENGLGQLQRWLLHRDPQNEFVVRPPPASMLGWSLADWQAGVKSLWQPGSYYVWAQADLYRHGGTYNGVTWTRLPAASKLPPPTYYPSAPRQLDPDGRIIELRQLQRALGLAFAVRGLADASSIEYWLLPEAYEPAGRSVSAAISVGARQAGSLDAFIDVANQSWAPGCTFAITGCVNHHLQTPPTRP